MSPTLATAATGTTIRYGDERARELFERVVGHANDLGLLAEEIDPRDGSLLGNFPRAFSHVGLITAAWAINEATQREEADT